MTEKKKKTVRTKKQRDAKGRFLKGNNAALKWTEEKAVQLAEKLIAWMKEDQSNFMFKDFLFEHDLYTDLIADLSRKYPRFAEYIARAREIEAHRIQKYALANKLNPGMAQWILAVHHNQHNVQKQEVTGKDGAALLPQVVNIHPVEVVGRNQGEGEENE
jgi:hypothetical protein